MLESESSAFPLGEPAPGCWLRDKDSNLDHRVQGPVSYQLDDPEVELRESLLSCMLHVHLLLVG